MPRNSKKHVPSSRIIKIGFSEMGTPKVDRLWEEYPTNKDNIEKLIAEKIISHLNKKRKSNYVACKSEHPDFICKCNNDEFALELMELVPRCVNLRKSSMLYTKEIRKHTRNKDFYIEFCCPHRIFIPNPESEEGKLLTEAILEAIVQNSKDKGLFINGDHRPLMPRDACRLVDSKFIRNRYPNLSLYYSLIGPVMGGISYGITEEDYKELREKLHEKFQKDYTISRNSKVLLLLYSFESARPDFARLASIIEELTNSSTYYFSEVWYLKTYPNNLDDIRIIYKK